jgi:hypothetical protein
VDELHLVAFQREAEFLRLPALGKKGAFGGVCVGAVVRILMLFADNVLVINTVKPFKSQRPTLRSECDCDASASTQDFRHGNGRRLGFVGAVGLDQTDGMPAWAANSAVLQEMKARLGFRLGGLRCEQVGGSEAYALRLLNASSEPRPAISASIEDGSGTGV